ncbi:hypothetical protein RISK_003823 [Rhodopirellula islandica]|uniref:Uncharacterized protein n=1 Tax=Rhodopirellula islandica TaxID=595434 RepID=A0A0J1BC96_RHOIS|nr:hypothetical protein RISK_003823 [Rhodopirellula islandica]
MRCTNGTQHLFPEQCSESTKKRSSSNRSAASLIQMGGRFSKSIVG